MFLRRIALRNRHKTSEPRFRGQQIVVRIIAAAIRNVVADAEQFALVIKQKMKVHGFNQLVTRLRKCAGALQEIRGGQRRLFKRGDERIKPRQQRGAFRCFDRSKLA